MKAKSHHLVAVSGFSDKGVTELGEETAQCLNSVSFTHIHSIPPLPESQQAMDPQQFFRESFDRLEEIEGQIDCLAATHPVVFEAYSFGALMTLVLLYRRKMAGVLRAILIDGPLNRHPVAPHPQLAHHKSLQPFYDHRLKFVQEAERFLQGASAEVLARIFTVASPCDTVVPQEAKTLAALKNVPLAPCIAPDRPVEEQVERLVLPAGCGVNIVLPEQVRHFRGHALVGKKRKFIARLVQKVIEGV